MGLRRSRTARRSKRSRVLIGFLIWPRLLNYIVAIYLILTGCLGSGSISEPSDPGQRPRSWGVELVRGDANRVRAGV